MKTTLCLILILSSFAVRAQHGYPDPSFGANGYVSLSNNSQIHIEGKFEQTRNGDIIHARNLAVTNAAHWWFKIEVLKLDQNGIVDGSFGQNGITTIVLEDLPYLFDLALDPLSQEIYLLCSVQDTFFSPQDVAIIKLDSNGNLDSTFGQNGQKLLDLGHYENPKKILVQDDGKLLVGGDLSPGPSQPTKSFLVRLNKNGTMDNSFADQGVWIWGDLLGTEFSDVFLTGHSKVMVSGTGLEPTVSNNAFIFVAKLNLDGSFDSSFSALGVHYLISVGEPVLAHSGIMALTISGDLLLAGHLGPGNGVPMIACLDTSSGQLVQSFGFNGLAFNDTLPGGQMFGYSDMKVQPDGKIIVIGPYFVQFDENTGLLRFLPDGIPDTAGFGVNGFSSFDFGFFRLRPRDLLIIDNNNFFLGADFLDLSANNDGTLIGKFTDSGMMGIKSFNGKESSSVFPNPFHSEFRISGKWREGVKFILEIQDLTGKKVRSISGTTEQNKIRINACHNIPTGLFTYRLRVENKFYSGRMLKQ